ncbi:MAG: amidohydrolase family protein [Chloroflexia bacterium]
MIVDAHTHIFPPEVCARREAFRERDPWFGLLYEDPRARMATAEDLLEAMERDGVDRAVACGFAWRDQGLCRFHNDYLIESVRRFPDRIIGLAVVQPRAGVEAVRELERALDAGLRGLGELMPDGQGFSLTDEALLEPVALLLQERNLPLLTHASEPVGHLYRGKGCTQPQQIVALAERFPELRIICAHWGGGLPFYELMPEVAQALKNVFYDTAASPFLYRWRVVQVAVQMVGAHKILLGSDFPLVRPRTYLMHLAELPLEVAERAAILGGNALALWPEKA